MKATLYSIAQSWTEINHCLYTVTELLEWIRSRNEITAVEIRKISLAECTPWFFDDSEGCIRNDKGSFFTIRGYRQKSSSGEKISQPIIFQDEIGFLGIICKEFDGVMHFLMQAKIEPGNINAIQISPTLQATKSNFMQLHRGAKPPYLDYFINSSKYETVVDQIQSEQSSRFYKKRNRNVLIRVEEDIPVLPSHRWMTLGQIKRLMTQDNLVNMDTRTVISCIPYNKLRMSEAERDELKQYFKDKALFCSVFEKNLENPLPEIYQYINDYKMFSDLKSEIVPLQQLKNWELKNRELLCRHPYPFKVVFCDIAIEGREVGHWTQPLFEAQGVAVFGLLCCEKEGALYFVVKAKPEVGCFDGIELGPTVQREAVALSQEDDDMTRFFMRRLENQQGVVFDHLLSEEGGRFYHEQNRNVLIRIDERELPTLPEGYFLLDYRTLNEIVQINNVLNIQLRNLLSLLEA